MLDEKAIAELREKLDSATRGPVSIEKRDDDDGSIDFMLYAGKGDVAACFEAANENARANAMAIAALYNAAHSLLALASFGLKAKAFLEEHEHHILQKYRSVALAELIESARALTEAKGGK